MGSMTTFGDATKPAEFLTAEAHKLHRKFVVAADVNKGQPLKLNGTGLAVPLAAADASYLIVGHALQEAKASPVQDNTRILKTNRTTAIMRGHITMQVEAGAALVPGPVKWSGFNATTGKQQYVQATDDATTQGHSMEIGTGLGDLIEIVLI